MPSFKPKAIKKIAKDTKTILTVDNQHQDKMNVFKHIEENVIPELNGKIKLAIKKLKNIKGTDIDVELKLKDDIINLNRDKKRFKQEKKRVFVKQRGIGV